MGLTIPEFNVPHAWKGKRVLEDKIKARSKFVKFYHLNNVKQCFIS